ncbi:ADP-ribosylglycohydrolase family protein [Marinospirillum alkaliphilum]|uniref:ADP-ribosyl-[dinitrogen reductase] hydrolase n=1 Tax=Marinospirillum alkaliphilum DSM 21637 TaxID=1122209 RepID=A0A1K1TWB6_9GAMM|nr:ADP-ribosylglycohydrolase family protein [Marinospirillum alkaliphilum]SFX04999.1 ADP-ribosyl-[dinitrogen reductase] hydrolase [Marinospirillum alkaliphilum DSM 21637]
MPDRQQRYRGSLLGLAVGDALGTTLEFRERGSFEPISDMVGGGPFFLKPGQWTDDTSMALCLAHSLLECRGFDAEDQMRRYCDWRSSGYMSSNGRCFDIGVTVSEAISSFLRTGNPLAGSRDPFTAGNGSLMRLAPVVMYYSPDTKQALHFAGESSRTTHGAKECIDACRYFAALLHQAYAGNSQTREALLQIDHYSPETTKVQAIQQGEYREKNRDQIKGSGYVIDCLEAALWCFHHTSNFSDAVLAAANLGDDADTTAAVCGQIAGAWYGLEGIPEHWQQRVVMGKEILELADQLLTKP